MSSVRHWVLLFVHHVGRFFVVWIASPIFRWLYDGAHRGLPPINDPILMMRAVELATKIRKRQVCVY
jgi:hypothetical protein